MCVLLCVYFKNLKCIQHVYHMLHMCLYLYSTELDVCVVVLSSQPAEGPLSLLLSAQREEPPGGAGHEHQQHHHYQSWNLPHHCQPPPRYHQTCASCDIERMIARERVSLHCILVY